MSMITKDTVAEVLGLSSGDEISSSVYNWAIKQFFILTGLKQTEETKTYRKFVSQSTVYFKLPDKNIKTIDTLKVDNDEQSFTLFSDLKFNPDSGLINYSGGFGGGQLIEVTYTLEAYNHTDLHDFLISLLVTKALSMFTPDKVQQVRMVKIGKFQKQFGSSSANLDQYTKIIDQEILNAVSLINEDDGRLGFNQII